MATTFEIELNGKKYRFAYRFVQHFTRDYDPRWKHYSTITFAIIRRIPINKKETLPIRDFSGHAVYNPNDLHEDDERGQQIAFQRACDAFWKAITAELGYKNCPTRKEFWKLCRKARWLSEHPATLVGLEKVIERQERVIVPLPLSA